MRIKTGSEQVSCMGTRRNNGPTETNFDTIDRCIKKATCAKFQQNICKIASIPTYFIIFMRFSVYSGRTFVWELSEIMVRLK